MLDAIVISDSGSDSFSGTNPLKLTIDDRVADIQTVLNFIAHDGRVCLPADGDGRKNWAATPKLNGIYLSSYLSGHGFQVELIDSYYEQREDFIRLLQRSPRAILISTTFIINKQTLVQLVADVRSQAPNSAIIAGGPFVSISHGILERSRDSRYLAEAAKKEYLFLEVGQEPSIDLFIISARGEAIAKEALLRLRQGLDLEDLPNSARFTQGSYHFTAMTEDISQPQTPINWLSLPQAVFQAGVVPLQASNGCPYNCAFCNFVKDRRLVRVKPVDELIEEMRQVKARGAEYIWFVDDNFRLGKSDLEQVCRRMIAADLNLKWMTLIRAGVLEDIDAGLLRAAGCIEVQLGLESADPLVLENMNKKATPELYERVLAKLLPAGINCSCYLIFGFPGETDQSAGRTIAFMKKFENPNFEGAIAWSLFPFILAPLSPIYEPEMREKYQLSGYLKEWQHATMNTAQAVKYVRGAFFAVEASGSIYRSDNLDILGQMPARRRNQFFALRHQLAKAAAQGNTDSAEILLAFKKILHA